MRQINRLPTAVAAPIPAKQVLKFTFNGKAYQGVAGDTLASALLANGVNVVGRSFKYCAPPGHCRAWAWKSLTALFSWALVRRQYPI